MGSFDRDLTHKLTRALERDDMRTQASRINDMMSAVSLFVQKLEEAQKQISDLSSLKNEHTKLKNKREKSNDEESRLQELTEDIKAAEELERQCNKSKSEVQALINNAASLHRTLSKLY